MYYPPYQYYGCNENYGANWLWIIIIVAIIFFLFCGFGRNNNNNCGHNNF